MTADDTPDAADHDAPDARPERTRVGAYALCRGETGRILVVRYASHIVDTELWRLPGGGVEFGLATWVDGAVEA